MRGDSGGRVWLVVFFQPLLDGPGVSSTTPPAAGEHGDVDVETEREEPEGCPCQLPAWEGAEVNSPFLETAWASQPGAAWLL